MLIPKMEKPADFTVILCRLFTAEPNITAELKEKEKLEKEMATHSSILAWEIPWTEEPGGLQSLGSQRVGHD